MLTIPEVGIETIKFSVLTDDDINSMAVVEVNSTKQISNNKKPYPNGTYDTRMGAQFNYPCLTCGNLVTACPGHPGKLILNWPLVAPIYAKLIIKWVRIICQKCRKIIFDVDIKELYPKFADKSFNNIGTDYYNSLLEYLSNKYVSRKVLFCDHCNNVKQQIIDAGGIPKKFQINIKQPDFHVSTIHPDFIDIYRIYPSEKQLKYKKSSNFSVINDVLYTPDILELFESVADEEIIKLGLPIKSHPRNYINRYFLVPPVNIRFINSIKKKIGSDNHITSNIENIIKENEAIGKGVDKYSAEFYRKGPRSQNQNDKLSHIINLITAHNKYIGFIAEDKTNSLYSLMKGKKGLIRELMLGKIISKACRYIISCNNSIKIDNIVLPKKFAIVMTLEEIVTPFNIDVLKQYVDRGLEYPGCTRIYSKRNQALRINDGKYEIELGDKVIRHKINGDIIMINRSPTLTISSITAMRAIISQASKELYTGQINSAVCKPFNADFDGDTMSGTSPDDEISREQAAQLFSLESAIIDYVNSAPMIGLIQDEVIGMTLLTMHDTKLSRYEVMQILNGIIDSSNLSKKEYTGRELLTMIMPDIDYKSKSPFFQHPLIDYFGTFDESDKTIIIESGIVKSGIICSNVIKPSKNSIYHIIYFKFGSKIMMDTVYNHQQVIKRFVEIRGITMSYKDIRIEEKSKELINLVKSKIMREVSEFNNRLIEGNIIPPEGMDIDTYVEQQMLKLLNPGHQFLAPILSSINPKENWLFLLVLSKAKGSLSNLYNIFASVGQMKINGKRLKQRLAYKRASIWEPQFSLSPASKGYIYNSYNDGLTLTELQPGGEELTRNILTKNIVTSEGGALSRIIILSTESAVVDNRSFTTRGYGINIIEFNCAGDGFSGADIYENELPLMLMSDKKIKEIYGDRSNLLISDRNTLLNIRIGLSNINSLYEASTKFLLPIRLDQLIKKNIRSDKHNKSEKSDLKIKQNKIDDFCDNLHYLRYNPIHQKKQTKFPDCMNIVFTLCKIAIRMSFTDDILDTYTVDELTMLLYRIVYYINKSFYSPGTPIGTILGQSLTSPITQYLIDAHHASTSGGTSRDGINYTKSQINVKKLADSKVKYMNIFLKSKYETNRDNVERLANYIIGQNLKSITETSSIIFGELGKYKPDTKDAEIIKNYIKDNNNIHASSYYKFYIKLTLSNKLMKLHKIKLEDICNRLEYLLDNNVLLMYHKYTEKSYLLLYFNTSFNWNLNDNKKSNRITSFWDNVSQFIKTLVTELKINSFGEIQRVHVHEKSIYENIKGEIIKKKIYYVRTNGINMIDVLLIDKVDKYRTRSNNPIIEYNFGGIISSRDCLISELYNTFNDAIGFNPNHYEILANIMSETGQLTAISETGHRQRELNDILLRSSIKDPRKAFFDGALNNITNEMSSSKSHIMLGQDPKMIGTSFNIVTLDETENTDEITNIDDFI